MDFDLSFLDESILDKLKQENMLTKLATSLSIVHKAFSQYSEEELSLAFNGGKDNMLLLHLIVLYLQSRARTVAGFNSIYFVHVDDFEEVKEFVEKIASEYKLNLIRIIEQPEQECDATTSPDEAAPKKKRNVFKDGLSYLQTSYPAIKAVFLGTRECDPYSEHLKPFMPTDLGWPCYMRVYPILPWTYREVWAYLLLFKVPYCSLYNQGYTSLGDRFSTVPNPELSIRDAHGNISGYRPAYELRDESLERSGRLKISV